MIIKLIMKFSPLFLVTALFTHAICDLNLVPIEYEDSSISNEDMVLIGTADGLIHAIGPDRNEKWTLDTGGPTATAYNADDREYAVLPAADGTIYINGREGMAKTSVKARMIAEKAPFMSTQDNLIFTGQKSSRILGVDARSGKIIHDSHGLSSKLNRGIDSMLHTKHDRLKKSSPIWLGRTEYSFRAFDSLTGIEQFNVTYAEVEPLTGLLSGETDDLTIINIDTTTAITYDISDDLSITTSSSIGNSNSLQLPATSSSSIPTTSTMTSSSSSSLTTKSSLLSSSTTASSLTSKIYSHPHLPSLSALKGSQITSAFAISSTTKNKPSHSSKHAPLPSISTTSTSSTTTTTSLISYEMQKLPLPPITEQLDTDLSLLLPQQQQDISIDSLLDPMSSINNEDDSSTNNGKYLPLSEDITNDSTEYKGDISSTDMSLKPLLPSVLVEDHQDYEDNEIDQTDTDTDSTDNNMGRDEEKDVSPIFAHTDTPSSLSTHTPNKRHHYYSPNSSPSITSPHSHLTPSVHYKLRDDSTSISSSHTLSTLQSYTFDALNMVEEDISKEAVQDDSINHVDVVKTAIYDVYGQNIYTHNDDVSLEDHFLKGDNRLCVTRHQKETDKLSTLPLCNEGNHRLLPALITPMPLVPATSSDSDSTITPIKLPYFVRPHLYYQSSESMSRLEYASSSSAVSGDNASSGTSTVYVKPTLTTRIIQSVQGVIRFLSDTLALIIILTAVIMIIIYILHRYGYISANSIDYLYKQFMQMIGLPTTPPTSTTIDPALLESMRPLPPVPPADEPIEEIDSYGNKLMRIGSLVLSQQVLGYGSSGTVVFRGSLNGRAVAVKRLLTQFNWTAEREIALLIKSDGHPNVVRYFLSEKKGDFVYLCLQLCSMSLKDFVVKLQQYRQEQAAQSASTVPVTYSFLEQAGVSSPVRQALHQVAEGLAHLHAQRIVHRDIKPHNILCALPETEFVEDIHQINLGTGISSDTAESITDLHQIGNYILKISDMGLSKQLTKDQESVSGMSFSAHVGEPSLHNKHPGSHSNTSTGTQKSVVEAHPVGTIGWQAPELISLRGMSQQQKLQQEKLLLSEIPLEEENGDDDTTADNTSIRSDHTQSHSQSAVNPLSMENHSISLSEPPSMTNSTLLESTLSPHTAPSSTTITSTVVSTSVTPTTITKTRFKPQNVDIFSLGCVFHYVLSGGQHPFGQWYEREANIVLGKPDLSLLQNVPDAMDLTSRMIAREPRERPSAKQICHHPFFWSAQKRLDFFVTLSDRLEVETADSPVVLHIESDSVSLLGRGGWDRRLDQGLLEDMGRYRKYDSCCVRDLLRVIRNKRSHYSELSPTVKALVGEIPKGFLHYFETKFPKLLMHCIRVVCTHYAHEKDLSVYCSHITTLFKIENNPPKLLNQTPSSSSSSATIINTREPRSYNMTSTPISSMDVAYSTQVMYTSMNENSIHQSVHTMTAGGTVNTHSVMALQANAPSFTPSKFNTPMNGITPHTTNATSTMAPPLSSFSESTSEQPVHIDSVISSIPESNLSIIQPSTDNDQAITSNIVTVDSETTVSATIGTTEVGDVVVWYGSALSDACKVRGWWRDDIHWIAQPGTSRPNKQRPSHLTRSSTDPKYRSRLCSHWEMTQECAFKKKGKCDFAHGPLELRIKDIRRDKWGQHPYTHSNNSTNHSGNNSVSSSSRSSHKQGGNNAINPSFVSINDNSIDWMRYSGGEDVLGAARSNDKIRSYDASDGGNDMIRMNTSNNNNMHYNGNTNGIGNNNMMNNKMYANRMGRPPPTHPPLPLTHPPPPNNQNHPPNNTTTNNNNNIMMTMMSRG